MKSKRKTTSVLKFWVLSYLSVLGIPLTVSITIFGSAFSIMEEEVSSAHLNSLKQIQYSVDSQMSAVANIAAKLTTNEQIGMLQGVRWQFTPSEHYLLQGIQKDLKALCNANSFLQGIYVYHLDSGILLSDRDVYRSADFTFANQENFQLREDVFYGMLTQKYSGQFLFMDAGSAEEPHTQVLYAITLPLLKTSVVKVNLFVSVDWKKLNALLEERNWARGNYVSFLTDENYQVLAPYTGEARNAAEDLMNRHGEVLPIDTWETDLNGSPFRVSCIDSQVMPGRYFSVLPRAQYRAKIDRLLHIMLVGVGICVITGGILSYVYVRRNYRPVRDLVNLVNDPRRQARLPGKSGETSNEYAVIQENIRKMLENEQNRQEELDWSLRRLRESTLVQLMKTGGRNTALGKEELKKRGLLFSTERFLVTVICVTSFENLFFDGSASDDEETYGLVLFIIRNVAEELLSAHFEVELAEAEGDLGILLGSSFELEAQARECALYSLRQAQKFIGDTFGVRFRFAISSLREGYEQIWRSWAEAQQILEYNELMGSDQAVFSEEIHENGERPAGSAGLLCKLLNCMLAGDFTAAAEQVELLIAGYSRCEGPPRQVKNRVLGLVGIFLDGLEEISRQNPQLIEDLSKLCEELNATQQLNQLEERMLAILSGLHQAEEAQGKSRQNEMAEEMIRYVEDHLCDPGLTITTLADQFGLSISYASKLFKNLNHTGFLSYVHKRRVELAQTLLVTSEDNLNVLADKLGYNNDIALIRMFKKHTGITPGKFRELHKK